MRNRSIAAFAALATTALLGACSTDVVKEAEQANQRAIERTESVIEIPRHAKGPQGPMNVRYRDHVWLGAVGVKSYTGQPLPARFEGDEGFSLFSAQQLSLAETAEQITDLTGIPVNGADRIVGPVDGAGGQSATSPVNYVGPLSGFLKRVAAENNVSWRYRNGVITFFDVDTRTFTLLAPPSRASQSSRFESTNAGASPGDGGEDSENTGSTQGFTSSFDHDIWTRVNETLASILPETARYAMSPETGTITVTAKGPDLQRVEQYVKRENALLSKRVAVTVQVLSIDNSKTDDVNVNIDALLMNVGNTLGAASFGNILGTAAGAGIASAVEAAGDGDIVLGVADDDYNVSIDADGETTSTLTKSRGAAAVARIARTNSAVSLVTTRSTVTNSNQPSPIQMSTQQAYLKSSQPGETNEDGSREAPSLQPGVVTTGFSMNVLPRVLNNNRIALQYDIALSDLKSLDRVESGGSLIQTPEVDTSAFMQNLTLRSGQTIVAAAFEQTEADRTDSKTGLLGRGRLAATGRKAFVVLLTPILIEDAGELAPAPLR